MRSSVKQDALAGKPRPPAAMPGSDLAGPSRQSGEDGLPTPQRFWAIIAVSLNTIMVVIDSTMAIVALPTASRALSITESEAISLVAITQFISLVGLLPLSAIGDRIGHARLFRAGQVMFIAGSLLCMFAPDLPALLAARTIQAMGAAAVLSVGIALLRAIYPSISLGKGLGINGVLIAMGAAIAPSLGGLVVATLGWRWVFICPLPLAIGSLLLSRFLPRSELVHPEFDWRGALFYSMAAASIAGAFCTIAYWWRPAVSATLFVVAVIVATLFVKREAGLSRPILPVDLLSRPRFALTISASYAAFTGSMTMLLSLPFFLESIVGENPAEIGALMMAWPLAMMFSAPLAGALADRLPAGSLSAFGMATACAGYIAMANTPADAGHLNLLIRIALCGVGMGFFVSPNSRLLLAATPRSRTAAVGGLISTTRILGQSSGAALVALLMQPGIGRSASAPFIAATFVFVAALFSLGHLLPSHRNKSDDGGRDQHILISEDFG